MPIVKLTRRTVAALATPVASTIYYDSDVKGFGLACRPTGSQSWIVEYRPGAGGRNTAKRRLTIGAPEVMTVEAARSEAKAILARVRLGADPAAERRAERTAESVADLAKAWFERHVKPKRKSGTAAFYRSVLDTHILPRIGPKKAIALTRLDIVRLHGDIAGKRRGPTKTGAKRSPEEKTRGGRVIANRALAVTAAMYSWGIEIGLLGSGFANPAKGIEPFKEEARERYLSTEELALLGETLRLAETVGLTWEIDPTKADVKHAPKPENRRVVFDAHVIAGIRLLLLTGARLREILHLEWSHIDWDRGVLRLPDSKTGKKTIMLGGPALAVLEALPRLGRYVIASESAGEKDETPRRDLNRPWRAVRRAAGLPDLRIHDLRHGFAAIGAGSGLSLHQIGGLLGHTQSRTTQRYAHLSLDPQRRAADLIADKLALALGLNTTGSKTLHHD